MTASGDDPAAEAELIFVNGSAALSNSLPPGDARIRRRFQFIHGPCVITTIDSSGFEPPRGYSIGSDGPFVGYRGLICDNDEDAAKQLVVGADVELWSGARFLVSIGPIECR